MPAGLNHGLDRGPESRSGWHGFRQDGESGTNERINRMTAQCSNDDD
jgi:hypothetical protein